jgi:hypothetical protein
MKAIKAESERPLHDVTLHLRVSAEVLEVIKPAAEQEALRLTTWCRRVLVLAARERQGRAVNSPTN